MSQVETSGDPESEGDTNSNNGYLFTNKTDSVSVETPILKVRQRIRDTNADICDTALESTRWFRYKITDNRQVPDVFDSSTRDHTS